MLEGNCLHGLIGNKHFTAPTLVTSLHQFCLLTHSCQHRSRSARMLHCASCFLWLLFLLQHDFLVFCIISTVSSCQSSLCYLTALRVCHFQVSVGLIIAWKTSPPLRLSWCLLPKGILRQKAGNLWQVMERWPSIPTGLGANSIAKVFP